MTLRLEIISPEDLHRFSLIFGGMLDAGGTVGFIGDLGAGKTFMIKGIAAGFGCPDDVIVTSPTYTILNIYSTVSGRQLFHFDVYRLSSIDDLEQIGLRDYLEDANALCVYEWFDIIQKDFDRPRIEVRIDIVKNGNGRRLTMKGVGKREMALIEELERRLAGDSGFTIL